MRSSIVTAAALVSVASAGSANAGDGWGLYQTGGSGGNGGEITTSVVNTYVTACSEPTTIVNHDMTYTVTEAATVTITASLITVTKTVSDTSGGSGGSGGASSYGSGGAGGDNGGSSTALYYTSIETTSTPAPVYETSGSGGSYETVTSTGVYTAVGGNGGSGASYVTQTSAESSYSSSGAPAPYGTPYNGGQGSGAYYGSAGTSGSSYGGGSGSSNSTYATGTGASGYLSPYPSSAYPTQQYTNAGARLSAAGAGLLAIIGFVVAF